MHHVSEFINELSAYEGEVVVLKCGGEPLVQGQDFLKGLAKQILMLQRLCTHIVLVHGAGPQIKEALAAKGIQRRKDESGRFLTSAEELSVVHKVMDKVNLDVSLALMQAGCRVFSVAAGECCLLKAMPLHAREVSFSGAPVGVDADRLDSLFSKGQVFVTHSLGVDQQTGSYLNVNADDCAMAFSVGMKAKRLVLATDTDGILDDKKKTISVITKELSEKLVAKGVINGGMAVKVESALAAVEQGVGGVAILNAFKENSILMELGTKAGGGTLVVLKKPTGLVP